MKNHLLIQFPDEMCEQIAKGIDAGKLPPINLMPVSQKSHLLNSSKKDSSYQREFQLRLGGKSPQMFRTKLMDLPCIIECQKTYNKSLYFKTGDISQVLVVESNHNKDTSNSNNNSNAMTDDTQYILDSGLTPPASEIRTRWSHRRPICQHDDAEVDHLCAKCHNIPRELIKKISTELYNRIHCKPSETWELITTEEWIEVTDDEESESEHDIELDTDSKLKSNNNDDGDGETTNESLNQKEDPPQPRDEWEVESDDDDIAMNKNSNSKHFNKRNTGPHSQSRGAVNEQRRNRLDRPLSAGRGNADKQKLQRPLSVGSGAIDSTMNHNKNKKDRPTSSLRVPSITRMGPLERPPSIKRDKTGSGSQSTRSMSRPQSSTQPPLPSLRTTPRRTTPIHNTPLLPGMGHSLRNKVIKVNTDSQQIKNNREKKMLEEKLKAKQGELEVQEKEVKTQKNRRIKKKAIKKRDDLKKEIAEIEAKVKAM